MELTPSIGRREEALLLLLVALVTLMVVSTAVLVSHKSSLNLLLLERRYEATQAARRLSRELAGQTLPDAVALRRLQGGAMAVGILADGTAVAATEGFVPAPEPLPIGWLGWPYAAERQVVSGSVRLDLSGRGETVLQVDLPAIGLAASARGLRILVPMVLGIDAALSVLLLFYVRHLVAPFDRALRRARESGRLDPRSDELAFLLSTFEEAIATLSPPPAVRRLAERLAEIGEVSAGLAHELRNSLATLTGYLTLAERGGDPEAQAEYLAEIRHESDHLRRVVDDFLAFARPARARREEVDLAELLERAVADPALGGTAAAVEVREPGADHRITGDRQLLGQAFRNLLRNAVEAQRDGEAPRAGPEVTLARDGDAVVVRILDRGPGIPEDIRPRLFLPFVSGRAGGVGLGLAVTHRIVEQHRGSVSLADRPGGGTEARVRLPRGADVTDRNDPP